MVTHYMALDEVCKALEAREVSNVELAKRAGLSQATIINIRRDWKGEEGGTADPGTHKVMLLFNTLQLIRSERREAELGRAEATSLPEAGS